MGVEIRLSDRELPVSPVLIDFLHRLIHGRDMDAHWHDQRSEALVPMEAGRRAAHAREVAESVLAHPLGQRVIFRAYELFTALLTGDESRLKSFQRRFRFLVVVGCPRHGGTYLTKALFQATGQDPARVPAAIAHDGFPDAAPFFLEPGRNGYAQMLLQTAEYLAMVEAWFGDRPAEDGKIVVPKKATKAAYQGGFFRAVFGEDAEWIITLRHPLAACISTYEKSGGWPADGRFVMRSNIEEWAARDLRESGVSAERLEQMPYIGAYLGYWRNYHLMLASTGFAKARHWRVVAYGRERLMEMAAELRHVIGGDSEGEDFEVEYKLHRHPDWISASDDALHQIESLWQSRGMPFPSNQLREGW